MAFTREDIVEHLQALKKLGKTEAVVDVDALLSILQGEGDRPRPPPVKITQQSLKIDVDGGLFKD